MGSYNSVKKWRSKSEQNRKYNVDYMRERRQFYKQALDKRLVAYMDIPISFRPLRYKDKWILKKV